MNGQARTDNGRRGQTLVMALIILSVLMVLGVVFIALINRNIRHVREHQQRSMAYDLAEAGVRYAHGQMLNSLEGLDWRPSQTILQMRTIAPLYLDAPINDPDYEYLRMPNPADVTDHGGPDKQGPYVRVNFDKGRALVRVRYAPSDPTVFASTSVGGLFQPGMARNYTIIESVGKAKTVTPNDPTQSTLQSGQTREIVESKKVVGFVSCGMLEYARFVHNKYNVSAPVELGFPTDPGIMYADFGGTPTTVQVPIVLGSSAPMWNPYDPSAGGSPAPSSGPIYYGGGTRINGDLLVHGNVIENINSLLGDGLFVAGEVRGADDASKLTINLATPDYTVPNNPTWLLASYNLQNNTNPSLNSNNPNFSTIFGVFKDAFPNGDAQGYPRGVPQLPAPSIVRSDPNTGQNRYVQMTQSSGKVYTNAVTGAVGNAGRFGFGPGVFVNNSADIQIPTDEQGREDVGSAESLVYDWLNPNNGQANSGWKGAFYVPRGAYLRLFNDGFMIIRDGRAPANQRAWREPDGSPSKRPGAQMSSQNSADIVDSPYIRYKLVPDPATGEVYVFNSYSVMPNGTVIDLNQVNSGSLGQFRAAGYVFNGVLYFQGNVRVRGQIPTDMQLTVVSNATIYIEGSITKGVVNAGTRSNIPIGRRIDTPSKSMLALLAKDYVTLNTTQFFGSVPQQGLEEVKDNPGPVEWNPVRVRTGGAISLETEFVLNPNTPASAGGNPNNPSSWRPYSTLYTVAGSANLFEPTSMLFAQTMDDGPAPATFVDAAVNYKLGNSFASGSGEWQYLFDLSANNAASPYYPLGYTPPNYTVANRAPLYGLGVQGWQRYSKFEGAGFTLVSDDFTFDPLGMTIDGASTSPTGLYHLLVENDNVVTLGLHETVGGTPTNDYVLARAAIVPHDIRIEATIFAEEGSFFVIPGPWFNPNPNDRRDNYLALGATNAERDLARLESFGSTPQMPFYGEPLDVKIQILGSVTENMPPPIGQQAEWLKKWGWIPRYHGATGELIPDQHVPAGYNVTGTDAYVPNITITYDPALATDRNGGFVGVSGPAVDANTLIRYRGVDLDGNGTWDTFYALPPLPRLPASPTLAYFGEVNP